MSTDVIRKLVEAGHRSPSADNSQPWTFTWDGQTLSLQYDSERVAGRSFGPYDPATLLAMGGVIENLFQFLEEHNIQASWAFPPLRDESQPTYTKLSSFDASLAKETDFQPLFTRHTNRFKYRKQPIPDSVLSVIGGLSEGSSRLIPIIDEHAIANIAALVRQATEIRFRTKEVHEWLVRSLRFSAVEVNRGDGLDVATLNLPPGGNLFLKLIASWKRMAFLNKLGAFKMLSLLDSQRVGKGPALLAIVSSNEIDPVLSAGRLMTRTWTALNAKGIGVHPYYVVTDQIHRLHQDKVPKQLRGLAAEIAHRSQRLFQLGNNENLQMLLRIGYPTRAPIRSKRLPIEAVFKDRTT